MQTEVMEKCDMLVENINIIYKWFMLEYSLTRTGRRGSISTFSALRKVMSIACMPATLPATSPDLLEYARRAGAQAVRLAQTPKMKPRDIVTKESFENAIMVHAAISGSSNALLHIPAIAHEFGIEITGETFDRLHRGAHYLLDLRPAGRWPAEFFYYAGGVPAIIDGEDSLSHIIYTKV